MKYFGHLLNELATESVILLQTVPTRWHHSYDIITFRSSEWTQVSESDRKSAGMQEAGNDGEFW